MKREPLELVQYKAMYVPDLTPTESAFVFKCHHSMADGLALIGLTCHLGDKFDLSQLPGMKKLSFFEKLYVYSTLPFSLFKLFLRILFMRKDENILHPKKPLSGLKRSSLSRDF